MQNSIKASLECQKELSDELKDCKRNLSELLSVFVELQQESRRYRLADKDNEVPLGSFGINVTENDGTPLNLDEEEEGDDDANDGDVDIPNDPINNNNKLLTANDVSSYWQSPFDLLDGKSSTNYYNNHKQLDHQHHNHKQKPSLLNQNNGRNQLQISHHSIINTDSEDASLGYESENSTTASTTAGNNNNQHQQQHLIGHITNGRRRPRRYQQHRQPHNNLCCSANTAATASPQSISGPSNVNHHHHHHCNCRFRDSDSPVGPPSAHHGSVSCDCLHRFVQPIPICLHGGVSCMGQSHHHHQCQQLQQQQQTTTGALDLDSSQQQQHNQPSKPTIMAQGASDQVGGPVASCHAATNEGNQQQQVSSSTEDNLSSCAASDVGATPSDDNKATTKTPTSDNKTTNKPLPNSSLLSNKLRLIKMMEGSKYLKQWERLASLDLGSILHNGATINEDDLTQSIDSNSITGGGGGGAGNATTTVCSSQEDSYEKRRQNAAATMATLSGLRSQLLSQITLSSSQDSGRASGMIDDGQQQHESSSATTAASTPSNSTLSSSSSLLTSSTTNDNNQSEMMIDVGKNGVNSGLGRGASSYYSSHELKKRSCLQTRPATNGFNLLLSKGAPVNDNNTTTNGSLNGLGALLGGKAADLTTISRAGSSRLSAANCVTSKPPTQQTTNVTKALELKRNCDGIIASTLSLRAQNGPPLTMDEMRRKLRLTDSSSSDSDSEELPSQLRDNYSKDKKGELRIYNPLSKWSFRSS